MTNWLIPLDRISVANVDQAGAKAASLGALLAAGFPIPHGWCIPALVFRAALARVDKPIGESLSRFDLASPTEASHASDALSRILSDLVIADDLARAIDAMLGDTLASGQPLAIRSSATSEDRAEASLAGQHDTTLGVVGRPALHDAILAGWRSYFSAHALGCIRQKGREWGHG